MKKIYSRFSDDTNARNQNGFRLEKELKHESNFLEMGDWVRTIKIEGKDVTRVDWIFYLKWTHKN